MFGEATPDVSGTFAGEAIRLSIQIAALYRIEFTILAGDQIIGKREARHRLEASRPSFQVGPVGDLKPALRHKHHAAPAADIGNRAIIADEEWLVFDCLVDKRKCGL